MDRGKTFRAAEGKDRDRQGIDPARAAFRTRR